METGFLFQQWVGLEGEIVALALLFADVQQTHPGSGHLQHIPAVNVAEQGELVEIGRLAIHVGAHIQHQYRLAWILGGEQGPDRRAFDARQPTQPENGRGHHSA